jgi:hypothetical protein
MNGTWETRRPGATDFVPVPNGETSRIMSREGMSGLVAPPGSAGAEFRFRSEDGGVSRSVRLEGDLSPALSTRRGLE